MPLSKVVQKQITKPHIVCRRGGEQRVVTVMYKSYMEKVTLYWDRIFIRWFSSSVLLSSTTETLPPLQNNNSTCRPSTKLEKILNVINCTGQYTTRLSMFVVKNKDRVALNVFILVISKKGRKKTQNPHTALCNSTFILIPGNFPVITSQLGT